MVNILVADDHQLLIDGIKSTLSGVEDLQVVGEANNGIQVLEKLESGLKVDIILMDINMPELDGLNCTKQVHKIYPEIRIIALSQFDEKRFVKLMVRNGASGYLLKDVGKEILVQAIRTVFSGDTYYFDQETVKSINNETHKEDSMTLFPNFSERELEILAFIGKGLSSQEIANLLFISFNTVETHRANLMHKAGVKNAAELIRWAAVNALLE